jgi:hypothetical protein
MDDFRHVALGPIEYHRGNLTVTCDAYACYSRGMDGNMHGLGIVGHCPRCGSPIMQYTGSWGGIMPPPVSKTCTCYPELKTGFTDEAEPLPTVKTLKTYTVRETSIPIPPPPPDPEPKLRWPDFR